MFGSVLFPSVVKSPLAYILIRKVKINYVAMNSPLYLKGGGG